MSRHDEQPRIIVERRAFLANGKSSACLCILGPRSAGKTTLGRLLSGRLDVGFSDIDDELEKRLVPFGGLSQVIEGERWDLIDAALEESISPILSTKEPWILAIATGVCGYPIGHALQKRAAIFGISPGLNASHSADILIAREMERRHFKERLRRDPSAHSKLLDRYRSETSSAISIAESMADIFCFTGERLPADIIDEWVVRA